MISTHVGTTTEGTKFPQSRPNPSWDLFGRHSTTSPSSFSSSLLSFPSVSPSTSHLIRTVVTLPSHFISTILHSFFHQSSFEASLERGFELDDSEARHIGLRKVTKATYFIFRRRFRERCQLDRGSGNPGGSGRGGPGDCLQRLEEGAPVQRIEEENRRRSQVQRHQEGRSNADLGGWHRGRWPLPGQIWWVARFIRLLILIFNRLCCWCRWVSQTLKMFNRNSKYEVLSNITDFHVNWSILCKIYFFSKISFLIILIIMIIS